MEQNEGTDKLAQSVTEFYETHGAAFSATRHASWGVMRLVKDAVKLGDIMVDYGAGNGRLGLEIPEDVRYIAIEPSSALREAAQKNLANRKNSEIMEGGFGVRAYGRTPWAHDHAPVPVADSFADVAACLAVLHHIPTRTARQLAIEELARILKPGGTLVLTVWNLRGKGTARRAPANWLAAWLRLPLVQGGGAGDVWVPWKAEGADAKRYVHAFTLGELRSSFDANTWEVKKMEAWGNDGPTGILDARNLVVVAKKR
jgi:SAM-dependent methyltransferase